MASPQLRDGYTRIANEILEAVYSSDLNGTQLKILLCIWRFTYGFQRKEHGFSEAFISKAIHRHKNQVGPELQKLIERKIIKVEAEATFTMARVLAFNKNIEQWEQKAGQSVKSLTPSEPTISTVSKLTDSTVSKFTDQEKKVFKESIKEKEIVSKDTIRSTDVQCVVDAWNNIGITQITGIKPDTQRYKLLKARLREYSLEQILQAIGNVKDSAFLRGHNDKGWEIKFDWFVKPNNFIKVLEGNYNGRGTQSAGNVWEEWSNEQE